MASGRIASLTARAMKLIEKINEERDGRKSSRARASARRRRGQEAAARGIAGEARAIEALEAEGWMIHGRRIRTVAGEIDIIAEKAGLIVFMEVKTRARLLEAATALSAKQRARLMKAAEIVLAGHPEWRRHGVRFDMMLVDRHGRVQRIGDAFREE